MRSTRIKRSVLTLTLVGVVTSACAVSGVESDGSAARSAGGPASEIVLTSEVEWEQLNPARGDSSPLAGTLWGDRNGAGPTGFLFKPVDGFRSPPHLHNVSYRGVVISGLVHNDDPSAADMWMPTGSFWTQPKGAVHVTAAKGTDVLAYIEIEEGPYRVLPIEQEFDGDEAPINVDESNLVWVDPPGTPAASVDGPEVAYVWGSPRAGSASGVLLKLPRGFQGTLRGQGARLQAVVIRGRPSYRASDDSEAVALEPGSYFSARGESAHRLACGATEGSVLYLRVEGTFDVAARPGR